MTDKKPENPPAFPHLNPNYDGNWDKKPQRAGMSLRDYFAAATLTGLLADKRQPLNNIPYGELGGQCYAIADVMLKAREEV